MSALWWGLFGGTCAVIIEVIFKRFPGAAWWPTLWFLTLPLQAGINLTIWHILQRDTILGVAIWFSASTALLRLIATLAMGSSVPTLTGWAYGLTLAALGLKLLERR